MRATESRRERRGAPKEEQAGRRKEPGLQKSSLEKIIVIMPCYSFSTVSYCMQDETDVHLLPMLPPEFGVDEAPHDLLGCLGTGEYLSFVSSHLTYIQTST